MPIKFYKTREDYDIFSNVTPIGVSLNINGKEYNAASSEALYQGIKGVTSTDPVTQDTVKYLFENQFAFGAIAQQKGKPIQNTLYKDGQIYYPDAGITVKEQLMYEICLAKATQNPEIAKALLETGSEEIIENTALAPYDDPFWGNGYAGAGRNALGKVWMRVREDLKKELASGEIRVRSGLSDDLAAKLGHASHASGSQLSGKVIKKGELDIIPPKKLASEIDKSKRVYPFATHPQPSPQPQVKIDAPSPLLLYETKANELAIKFKDRKDRDRFIQAVGLGKYAATYADKDDVLYIKGDKTQKGNRTYRAKNGELAINITDQAVRENITKALNLPEVQTYQGQSSIYVNIALYGNINLSPSIPLPAAPAPAVLHKKALQSEKFTAQEKGYFDWLKGQGVKDVMENARGANINQAKSVYTFASAAEAQAFKAKFLSDNTKFGDVFFDTRSHDYAVPINQGAVKLLKGEFKKATTPTVASIDAHIAEIDAAIKKVSEFDVIKSTEPTRSMYDTKEMMFQRQMEKYGGSRVAFAGGLLRNEQKEGWWEHAAASTTDLMMSIYKAQNYDLLSKEDIEALDKTQKLMLQTDDKGQFIGGLKADANFVSLIKESWSGQHNAAKRKKLIAEDVDLILYGGKRLVIDRKTEAYKMESIKAPDGLSAPSFTQKGFFSDSSGETADTVVLQAGGMSGHSSMRILKKEKADDVPGGYRYFYTKVDAGGGLEEPDYSTQTGTSIYTTEVVPVKFDLSGNPQEFTSNELQVLKKDPAKYQAAIRATLSSLITAEREILQYKNPQLAVDQGESANITPADKTAWHLHNNKIKALRGQKVPARCIRTPYQLSGNCTVFSTVRTIEALTNTRMANDMLQDFKGYDQNMVSKLQAQRDRLVAQKSKLEQKQQAEAKAAAEEAMKPKYTKVAKAESVHTTSISYSRAAAGKAEERIYIRKQSLALPAEKAEVKKFYDPIKAFISSGTTLSETLKFCMKSTSAESEIAREFKALPIQRKIVVSKLLSEQIDEKILTHQLQKVDIDLNESGAQFQTDAHGAMQCSASDDGRIMLQASSDLTMLLKVQRRDSKTGELLADSVDFIQYENGKVVSVITGHKGESRIFDLDKLVREAKVGVESAISAGEEGVEVLTLPSSIIKTTEVVNASAAFPSPSPTPQSNSKPKQVTPGVRVSGKRSGPS